MGDLKVIMIIMSAEQSFVEMIIRDTVQHGRTDPPVIFSVYHFTHQPEFILDLICQQSQLMHEIKIKHLCHVQSESVDIKLIHPETDGIQMIIHDFRIPLVQFRQQIICMDRQAEGVNGGDHDHLLTFRTVAVIIRDINYFSAQRIFYLLSDIQTVSG